MYLRTDYEVWLRMFRFWRRIFGQLAPENRNRLIASVHVHAFQAPPLDGEQASRLTSPALPLIAVAVA